MRSERHRPASVRAEARLPVRLVDGRETVGQLISFDGLSDDREHVALRLGPDVPAVASRPLVRLHSECLTGDAFGSVRCDCGPQLDEALALIAEEGGYVLYLRQEGRGIGLYAKVDAYRLQDDGLDTFAANRALGHGDDERDYAVAVEMLRALGVDAVTLLTNNPAKAAALVAAGLDINVRPTGVHLSGENGWYLATKASRHGHTLSLPND
jgi:GTP cyclohydrolase II